MPKRKRKQRIEKPKFSANPKWINAPKNIGDNYGFIYKITHLKTGKFYIGKKFFIFMVTKPPLKGRSKIEKTRRAKLKGNRRHSFVESDWKTYWGSSKLLWKDLEKYGESAFKREIILLCDSKWDCAYQELLKQLEYDVIFREDSYNACLNVRLRKRKIKNPL